MDVEASQPCPMHSARHMVTIPDENKKEYFAWKAGEGFVQDLLPGLSDDEREILLTGTCQEMWDSAFAKEECAFDCDGRIHPGVWCR